MKKIDSISNPIIKDLIKLKSKKYINIFGKYLVEGKNIINEAITSNIVDIILITNINEYKNFQGKKLLVSEKIINALSSNTTNSGAIAVCMIEEIKWDINKFKRIVILDSINNPGNLGNIIRTARALKYDAVVCVGNSVFKYNSKVISGSQGTIFNFPVIQSRNYEIEFKQNLYLFISDNSIKEISKVDISEPFALVFGNEANGISEEFINKYSSLIKEKVFIEINDDVESLSITSAASIALYEFNK